MKEEDVLRRINSAKDLSAKIYDVIKRGSHTDAEIAIALKLLMDAMELVNPGIFKELDKL